MLLSNYKINGIGRQFQKWNDRYQDIQKFIKSFILLMVISFKETEM